MTTLTYPYKVRPISDFMTKEMKAAYRKGDWGTSTDRVARGAQMLDEQIPDWTEIVQINTLQMASSCHCVLGQLFSSTAAEMDHLEFSELANETEVINIHSGDQSFTMEPSYDLDRSPYVYALAVLDALANDSTNSNEFGGVDAFLGFDRSLHLDGDYESLRAAWEIEIFNRKRVTA